MTFGPLYITPNEICSDRDLNPGFSRERAASLTGLDYRSKHLSYLYCIVYYTFLPAGGNTSLCEKYTPYTLNGIIGNDAAKAKLMQFSIDAVAGRKTRAVMICGPSGVGKTSAAHAIAYSNGFDIVELNASDYRDAKTLETRILPLASTRGLFSKRSLMLFDEVDELSKLDSGCERVILKLINESRHPIVLIANDYWSRKVAFLRDAVDRVDFKRPGTAEVLALLQRILSDEKKDIGQDILLEIAKRSNGDVRGAINDLELMIDAKPELIDSLGLRDRKAEIFSVLDKIFYSGSFDIARNAIISADVDMDMLLNWIGQNIPGKYLSKMCVYDAYESLSKASMFTEKASRKSYYGYLRYASVLMSAGVSLASNGNVSRLTPYVFPSRISRLSKTKKSRDAMNAIALKLSPELHANRKTIINDYFPIMSLMINTAIEQYGGETVQEYMFRTYKLEKEDVATIAGYSKFGS